MSPVLWSWGSNSKTSGFSRFGKSGDEFLDRNGVHGGVGFSSSSHSSTVEKLYAWEKKLYLEVKVSFFLNCFTICLFSDTGNTGIYFSVLHILFCSLFLVLCLFFSVKIRTDKE